LGHRPDTSGRCPQVDEISGLTMTRLNDIDYYIFGDVGRRHFPTLPFFVTILS